MNIQNDVQRTQNDNILLHLWKWYKKNEILKAKNKLLKNKIKGLQCKILIKKLRMETKTKIRKIENTNLEVVSQASKVA